MIHLKSKSIETIINNQHTKGSFAASPCFNAYNYCWLRDGSFIAYSMDLVGRYDASLKYFDWVAMVLSGYKEKVSEIISMIKGKEPLLNSDYLPARYTLDGQEIDDEWPNFQLDGFGIWLWALCQHIRITGQDYLIDRYDSSISIIIDYLTNLWNVPCFDCWEENGDKVHTSTLACIYGGLNSISCFVQNNAIKETTDKIKEYIINNCTVDSRLAKHAHSDCIDASLLWATVPFKVFEVDDKLILNTVQEIEKTLVHNDGVHRYPEDVYYGGGEWLILSSWLGWYYAEAGNTSRALDLLYWVINHADRNGDFPEQSLNHVNNPYYVERWKELWGEVASPSLWAHAMYLIFLNELKESSFI